MKYSIVLSTAFAVTAIAAPGQMVSMIGDSKFLDSSDLVQ